LLAYNRREGYWGLELTMDIGKLDQPKPPARGSSRMVTIACASLLAFNAFHIVTGYQSFLRYKKSLDSDPLQVERLVSMVYSFHPSLIRANLIDDQLLKYHFAGQMKEITNCFERSLALREEVYGKASPKICRTLMMLGFSYINDRNFAAAEAAFKRSLAICQANHIVCQSYDAPGMIESLDSLSCLYEIEKRYAEAEASERQAISLLRAKDGNDFRCGNQYRKLAELCKQQAKYESAIVFYQKNLALHEPVFGVNDQDSVYLRDQIAQCQAIELPQRLSRVLR
jgi:tetratricopeptide (TPR) repeat protein